MTGVSSPTLGRLHTMVELTQDLALTTGLEYFDMSLLTSNNPVLPHKYFAFCNTKINTL